MPELIGLLMSTRTYYVVRVKTPVTTYVLLKHGRQFETEDINEAWAAADRFLPHLPPDAQLWVSQVTESKVMR